MAILYLEIMAIEAWNIISKQKINIINLYNAIH